jgi:hypothetical protein
MVSPLKIHPPIPQDPVWNSGTWRTDANSAKQVLPLHHNNIRTSAALPTHHAIPDIPTAAAAGDSGDGVLHLIRAVDGGPHCNLDRAVGTEWEREWELQSLCVGGCEFGAEYKHVGVFGAA